MTEDARDVSALAEFQSLWTELVTIANECWSSTYRAAFSTIVGEALDVGLELLDASGHSLAHATRSIPVFNMIMPATVQAVLAKYGEDGIRDGDVFVTNDPWLCAGHLPDVAVVTPVFHRGALVAFVANVANVSDIGGNLNRPENRELFDEGLQIPIVRLRSEGRREDELWEVLLANVRTPDEVEGDLEAMTAANALGADRLRELLERRKLTSLERASSEIRAVSARAMRRRVADLADGTYEATWTADGFEAEVPLKISIEVAGESIAVDFPDAPPQVDRGAINCTLSYTTGHVFYALKCLLGADLPTNEGCFEPFTVTAPENSILNCSRPVAVDMRTRIGWQVHPLVFGAMAALLPEGVPAGCGQPALMSIDGEWSDGGRFQEHLILGAGMGGSARGQGESNSTFPSSAASGSLELLESRAPVVIDCRSLARDSAGTGAANGGLGEEVRLRLRDGDGAWMRIVVALERMHHPPYGLDGGEPGACSTLTIGHRDGATEPTFERVIELSAAVPSLTVTTAGGGGFGAPAAGTDTP